MAKGHEAKFGDFYEGVDEFQRLAQAAALETAHNSEHLGIKEVTASRGEAAQVIDLGNGRFLASVNEELGTKNIVADAMYELTGKSYDYWLGLDTAAAQFNDLISVGAEPITSHAHFVVGDKSFIQNSQRAQELVRGYKEGCDEASAIWSGGETGLQQGNVEPGRIVLSGSANGLIQSKEHLILGDKLAPGDLIIYLPSTGIHANGVTDVRDMVTFSSALRDGYATFLREGTMFGEALMEPAPIYLDAVRSLFQAGVDIHYMSHITGHGWRKLMRAKQELTYEVNLLPENPAPVFEFIQQHSGMSDEQMYATFNMGMGFAFYIPRDDLAKALGALQKQGWPARLAGHVQAGPKQVVITPKNIVFEADSLSIR